eukprot:11477657-Alexandrium_andersonii.AAC.1
MDPRRNPTRHSRARRRHQVCPPSHRCRKVGHQGAEEQWDQGMTRRQRQQERSSARRRTRSRASRGT